MRVHFQEGHLGVKFSETGIPAPVAPQCVGRDRVGGDVGISVFILVSS